MNRFANKVLQLGEANAELQIRSSPTTSSGPTQSELTDNKQSHNDKVTDSTSETAKVQNRNKTDDEEQSEQPTSTDELKRNKVVVNAIEDTDTSDKHLNSAIIELEGSNSDWFITCHQFISGLLFEPDLCQFFAEQSSIDLTTSKVDDKLSPYTRSILHPH